MINLMLWLLFGVLIGWIASLLIATKTDQDLALNMIFGMLGALLAGFLFSAASIASAAVDLLALMVSCIGALILLGIVTLVRRERPR
jgi:uncharacterized membrane protein YeaQ/YmgE (transglycosylase-associated protein family)